jgi:dTDP-4-dehydrorhamnose reductase
LLGAFGWNKLLTCNETLDYEAGAFELFNGKIRETAIAKLIRNISNHHEPNHLLKMEGWWERPIRFFDDFEKEKITVNKNKNIQVAPVLILGKRGTLGNAFAKICEIRNIPFRLLSREELDMCDPASIQRSIDLYKPWAIINAAGFVRVDEAEHEIKRCFESNTRGPVNLGIACQQHGIRLMSFSSDLVFDGKNQQPYIETDEVNPLNVYGQSKADKERLLTEVNPSSLIIRTSAFFGPWDQYNFAFDVVRQLQNGNQFSAIEDIVVSPTYVPDLVNRSLDLLIDEENHIWHIANHGQISWLDWAKEIAGRAGLKSQHIVPVRSIDMNFTAARPAYSVLKSAKGLSLPSLENAMERFMYERSEMRIAMAG